MTWTLCDQTEAQNRLQGSDEELPQQSEHTSRVQEEEDGGHVGGQLVPVCAGRLHKRRAKTSGVWTSQGEWEMFSQSSVSKPLDKYKLILRLVHKSHVWLLFKDTKTNKKKRRKKDTCVRWISLSALWTVCIEHPGKSSQCLYILSLYSLIVLWITCSAPTRWTLCSRATCVAPTSGEWRKPTCAVVSSKSCMNTTCDSFLLISFRLKREKQCFDLPLFYFKLASWYVTRNA